MSQKKDKERRQQESAAGYARAQAFDKETGELKEFGLRKKAHITHDNKIVHPSGLVTAMDPNEIEIELHNKNTEEILFAEMRPPWRTIKCSGLGFCVLPHAYFTANTASGRPAQCVVNYGDAKFKGNTKPSRPEEKKIMK